MSPASDYSVPENTSARSSAALYAQYRARLDEEAGRRARERIIEVRPSRVDLEEDSARPSSPAAPTPSADASRSAQSGDTGRRGAPRLSEDAETRALAMPFVYEPPALESDEIALKPSPLPRGMFIDLMV